MVQTFALLTELLNACRNQNLVVSWASAAFSLRSQAIADLGAIQGKTYFTMPLQSVLALNTIIADGNGAAFFEPPNFNLPLINLISPLAQ